uniref:AlNc14C133G7007 protein n=1 Tax=Albugo laibachii Nc14 TaxID=890382 RepID=F0WKF5_9STRA|nr:AlNc14C133G7007 [Albugo laibachii Nc14]|eukprot:CCA21759.1 AlNc14C133G7007 [Albugo laibachii Nc14]
MYKGIYPHRDRTHRKDPSWKKTAVELTSFCIKLDNRLRPQHFQGNERSDIDYAFCLTGRVHASAKKNYTKDMSKILSTCKSIQLLRPINLLIN